MMLPIKFNCAWVPDEAFGESELTGKPISDDDVVEKEITFYTIDHVRQNGPSNCVILSGGYEYLVTESYESVNSKISERLTFKFN